MPEPTSVSISVDRETLAKMRSFYADGIVPSSQPYVDFCARSEEVTVTVYNKVKDGKVKAVFQGPCASHEARIWGVPETKKPEPKPVYVKGMFPGVNQHAQIGSDEVGTGDFFGPVVVVAAYVTEKDIPYLQKLGVTDSKALTDEQIRDIGAKLSKRLEFSLLVLPPEKYNEVTKRGLNMNAIKAGMHNRALLNLSKKHPNVPVFQDQFAEPKLYFNYLKDEPEVLRAINFAVKGETKFLSVAAASILARYAFLRRMDEMNKLYGCTFPLGASHPVDAFAKQFAASYGIEAFEKVAKTNFSNMKRVRS